MSNLLDLVGLIQKYEPYNEQETKDKTIILEAIKQFEDILTRKNELVHMTSSAFAVNKGRDKVLVIHHNIYNSWSWTGGHADGEADLLTVAARELSEETGAKTFHPVKKEIFSLDILPVLGHIRRGIYVAPHLHLSAAFLIEVDEADVLRFKADENSGVRWIPLDQLTHYSNEPHMYKLYEKLAAKVRDQKTEP